MDSNIRTQLAIAADKKIIVLQGAGINIDRGAEESVEAMQYIHNAVLLIIGSGNVMDVLKNIVNDKNLEDKVKFIGKVPFQKLIQYTQQGDLGLSLDK
jgi:glycosyltransferase involved in cell wall biosynthesis